ncbi:MAG: metalloregulator ArsR/SmtB family transcription factor [Acetobacteraceae bacterium]|nr:metalloregulator ArsR/SmtB family transcription factor [Acetobacteraceae bacterium]
MKILGLLSSGSAGMERCVCEIIPAVGVDQSTVSKHLAILRGQGILSARREGRRVLYSLAHPAIGRLVRLAEELCLFELAETRRLVETFKTANDTD